MKIKKNNIIFLRSCWIFLVSSVIFSCFCSCKLTKFVPEDDYLLYKTKILLDDNSAVTPTDLKPYLRQTHNTEVLGFWKFSLQMYNLSPLDERKRRPLLAQRLGEAPVIYSEEATSVSINQIQKAVQNYGYFNAYVDTILHTKGRKLYLTYDITTNAPYFINSYEVKFTQKDLNRYAQSSIMVHEGDQFSSSDLDEDRTRITTMMRRNGYYFFEKNNLKFDVDSSSENNTVQIKMLLDDPTDTVRAKEVPSKIFTQYTIRDIYFYTDYNPKFSTDSLEIDSIEFGNYHFYHAGKKLLREKVILRHCYIHSGDLYNETRVNRTYSSFARLGAIKYVNISFDEVGKNELDCHIVISRSKLNSIVGEVEGTYSDGDWGVGAGISYVHRNVFRSSVQFSLSAKGSYEWRNDGGKAIEGEGKTGIKFPNSFEISALGRYQNRPNEFSRIITNISLSSQKVQRARHLTHNFTYFDLSLVRLPYISDAFRKMFLQSTNILKYSYEDHFIMGWNYGLNYNSFRRLTPYRSFGNLFFQVETAGNVLYGISKFAHLPRNEDGVYQLANVIFAQYAKFDFSATYHSIINEHHRFVYHAGVGVAYPYGNAVSIPFEKRYFAGGANSLRGWTARSLGPGTYKRTGSRIEYNNQAGDIKIDLNMEYRCKIWNFIHFGAFVDAGNIWTIRDYETQPGGAFEFDSFYKQIALSYGAGMRFDFSFLTFRVDFGVKLHDPSRISEKTQWRTVENGLGWSDDMSIHFAIGYPF